MTRTFESGPARRERTPIAIGIIGPSGSGKTKSALRIADGMARVGGGDTWVIDTNNRRSLHHADAHKFIALHMPPPYSPMDYGQAFQHAIKSGARRIIVDSMSDEWEGEGGVLDMHDEDLDRRTKGDDDKRDKMNAAAWIAVKRAHNKLKLWMFNQPVDWILNFRAKEKTKPVPGKGMQDQGWQPLGAEDLIYELLLKCLLRPQSDGKPTWTSSIIQEQALMKLPGWFRDLFTNQPQLSEEIGQRLAAWAAGAEPPDPASADDLIRRLDACSDPASLRSIEAVRAASWSALAKADKVRVKSAADAAKERVDRAAADVSHDEAAEIAAEEARAARGGESPDLT